MTRALRQAMIGVCVALAACAPAPAPAVAPSYVAPPHLRARPAKPPVAAPQPSDNGGITQRLDSIDAELRALRAWADQR